VAGAQQSPCADSLYQALRTKALNELSDREYAYFMQREKACTDYEKFRTLVDRPKGALPERSSEPPRTEPSTRESALGGGAEIYVRNLSDRPIIVNSVRVFDCRNIREGSRGIHYPKAKLRPGEERRIYSIRFTGPGLETSYRYEYSVSEAAEKQ
jgi:hypothetical protein